MIKIDPSLTPVKQSGPSLTPTLAALSLPGAAAVTATPTSTAVQPSTPTATLSPTPLPPSPTGTLFLCLEYSDFVKCQGNPQCQGLPLCPWSKPVVTLATLATLATRTPTPPVSPGLSPLGPVPPLALGIGGAVAMLVLGLVAVRLYKDRH